MGRARNITRLLEGFKLGDLGAGKTHFTDRSEHGKIIRQGFNTSFEENDVPFVIWKEDDDWVFFLWIEPEDKTQLS